MMEAYLRLRRESGFYLNTLSYSLQEHIILQKALKLKFDLETNIHRHDNKYKLYIKAESMNKFREIVLPFFLNHFIINYIINLNNLSIVCLPLGFKNNNSWSLNSNKIYNLV